MKKSLSESKAVRWEDCLREANIWPVLTLSYLLEAHNTRQHCLLLTVTDNKANSTSNIYTDTSRIMLDQISRNPVAQFSCHMTFTTTVSKMKTFSNCVAIMCTHTTVLLFEQSATWTWTPAQSCVSNWLLLTSFYGISFLGLGIIDFSDPIHTARKGFLILCLRRSVCKIIITRKFLCNKLANYRLEPLNIPF